MSGKIISRVRERAKVRDAMQSALAVAKFRQEMADREMEHWRAHNEALLRAMTPKKPPPRPPSLWQQLLAWFDLFQAPRNGPGPL